MRPFIDMITESSTYNRTIPRDLFNDANLLKCYGQVYINLQTAGADAELIGGDEGWAFAMDESDGSTYLSNVHLIVRGEAVTLKRPMNSRQAWPLYMIDEENYDETPVFSESGAFSAEMLAFLTGDTAE